MKTERILRNWDQFVDRRSLPYYRNDHKLMMRQLLHRYPLKKLSDLSDIDLLRAVHAGDRGATSKEDPPRSFNYFLTHLDKFLTVHDLNRTPTDRP